MWSVSLLLMAMAIPAKPWIVATHGTVDAPIAVVTCTDGRNQLEIVGSDCDALNKIAAQSVVVCVERDAEWSVAVINPDACER